MSTKVKGSQTYLPHRYTFGEGNSDEVAAITASVSAMPVTQRAELLISYQISNAKIQEATKRISQKTDLWESLLAASLADVALQNKGGLQVGGISVHRRATKQYQVIDEDALAAVVIAEGKVAMLLSNGKSGKRDKFINEYIAKYGVLPDGVLRSEDRVIVNLRTSTK